MMVLSLIDRQSGAARSYIIAEVKCADIEPILAAILAWKHREALETQSARFRAEIERMIEAGEL